VKCGPIMGLHNKKIFLVLTAFALFLFIKLISRSRQTRTNEAQYGGYKDCRKKTKVGFLKTHKCASSSLQNILMRFSLNNDLNIVLPSAGNYLGRYVPYSRTMIANTLWDRVGMGYDIFCLHTIWNYEEVEKSLGPGAAYVTIMRDPVDLFESLWSYAGLSSYYNTDLETFALSPKLGQLATRAYRNLGRNQMLWDAGLSGRYMDNMTAIDNKIAEIDKTFHLVMMADRFDESVILMKDLLCWDFNDVVNFKLNSRKENKKIQISDEAREALKEYLAGDYKLYNHFKSKFDSKIRDFGVQRMAQELSILNHANSNMKEKCGIAAADNDRISGENKLWGQGMVAYTAQVQSDSRCKLFAMSEMSMLDHMRDVQSERAAQLVPEDSDHLNNPPYEDTISLQMKRLPQVRNGIVDIEKLKELYVHN